MEVEYGKFLRENGEINTNQTLEQMSIFLGIKIILES